MPCAGHINHDPNCRACVNGSKMDEHFAGIDRRARERERHERESAAWWQCWRCRKHYRNCDCNEDPYRYG